MCALEDEYDSNIITTVETSSPTHKALADIVMQRDYRNMVNLKNNLILKAMGLTKMKTREIGSVHSRGKLAPYFADFTHSC